METINYQGREIEAVEVNQMHGYLGITAPQGNCWLAHDGDEDLFRDAEGQYYLRRTLKLWDYDSTSERHASGRTHVHRLSVKAAILWAIMRCNAQTDALRRDAVKVLTRPPVVNGLRGFADGSATLTMHLKPAVASLVRAVGEMDGDTPLGVAYEGLSEYLVGSLTQEGGRQREQELLKIFSDNAPEEYRSEQLVTLRLLMPDGAIAGETALSRSLFDSLRDRATVYDGALAYVVNDLLERGLRMVNERGRIIELDDRAETLLERYHRQEYGEPEWSKTMPADIVNGVLVNWLEAMLRIHEGRTDDDAIEEATRRRVIGIMDDEEEEEGQEEGDEQSEDSESREAMPGMRLDLSFQLDAFHTDLLRAFVGRHKVDVNALTRAVLVHHLGEIFDYGFNGGEVEVSTAEGVREHGDISEELTPQRVRELCRAAGLDPEKYLNAAGEYESKLDLSAPPPPPVTFDPKADALEAVVEGKERR